MQVKESNGLTGHAFESEVRRLQPLAEKTNYHHPLAFLIYHCPEKQTLVLIAKEKITILITDDHTLLREAWSIFLNADPRFKVLGLAGTGEEAIELVNQFHPDIVLMDINLPGINGMAATQLIRRNSPATKILGVSMHTQPSYARKMLRHGASGYISKDSSSEEMCKAIMEVHNNQKYIGEAIINTITNLSINSYDQQTRGNSVSKREIEVMDLVSQGYSSREIGDLLAISIKTVEAHRYKAMKKLNLKNVAAMVNYSNSN